MRATRPAALCAAALLAAGLLAACTKAQDLGSVPHSAPATAPPATRHSSPTDRAPQTSPSPSTTTTSPDADLPAGFGPGPPGHGLQRFYDQHVSWTPCGASDTCASIWVPLDYADPDGRAITIKAKLRAAGDQAHVQGTLLINPGGPGGSGIDYLGYVNFDAAITNNFNVLGFDPRGVGTSTPVHCGPDELLDHWIAADPTPDSPSEVATTVRLFRQYAAACVRDSGPLLAHVSTIDAARDLDVLRAVVKDPTLNYYGASYGTYLGATYAALFPDHVGRMVLDGAVDPERTPHALEIGQARGFQTELTAYLSQCVAAGNCPLGDSVPQAQQQLINLLHQLDTDPLPTTSGRPLTEGLAIYGLVVPLYSRANWPVETTAIEQALEGNGDTLLYLADQYTHRGPSGHYTDNSLAVQSAINCLDHPEHESLDDIRAGRAAFVAASPVFGPFAAWFPYPCSNWPIQPSEPKPDYSAPGAAPILVVGTTRDPATPYQDAVNLAHELRSGVLLTRDGDGHTAYSSGNVCIREAVDSYLTTGRPPAEGTTC
jgi:pimeloyl-ACP methyl ester carboxylesterase